MLAALLSTAAALQGLGRRGPCAARRAAKCVAALGWEECGGCQVLRPQQGRPRAMVHFLGGVAVSPAPQVAYRHLLEQLSERGYLVVATPYTVDFDYGVPVAEIQGKFGGARGQLAAEFGELPLLGLGHSLGALMQTLLVCQDEAYAEACAGLALVSWNNKPVSDAIPLFEQFFVPALAPLAGPLEQVRRRHAAATHRHCRRHVPATPRRHRTRTHHSAAQHDATAHHNPGSRPGVLLSGRGVASCTVFVRL